MDHWILFISDASRKCVVRSVIDEIICVCYAFAMQNTIADDRCVILKSDFRCFLGGAALLWNTEWYSSASRKFISRCLIDD